LRDVVCRAAKLNSLMPHLLPLEPKHVLAPVSAPRFVTLT
jgi:hypothetical protein